MEDLEMRITRGPEGLWILEALEAGNWREMNAFATAAEACAARLASRLAFCLGMAVGSRGGASEAFKEAMEEEL